MTEHTTTPFQHQGIVHHFSVTTILLIQENGILVQIHSSVVGGFGIGKAQCKNYFFIVFSREDFRKIAL